MNSGGVSLSMNEAPQGFQLEHQGAIPMNVNPTTNQMEAPTMAALQSTAIVAVPTQNNSFADVKKKRGRPRKYGPGATVTSAALSPMPISASIPLSGGDFSGWKPQNTSTKPKPFQPLKKAHKLEPQSVGSGDQLGFVVGADFTSHVITVNAGEDVAMKVLSFSQEGSRAICVLSASGSISNVTLRQSNSAGGTLTYEGRFEILSLSGSFMPTDNGMLKSRSGGMSVSLAGPNGRVFGGGLAGLLIAASPVQVVVGSFLSGNQVEQKQKKQRAEPVSAPAPIPTMVSSLNGIAPGVSNIGYGGGPTLNFSSPPSTHTDPMASLNSQDSKDAETDNNLSSSSPQGESDEDSPSGFEI